MPELLFIPSKIAIDLAVMAKAKVASRPSNLSTERIQDSSDEDESQVQRQTPKSKSKISAVKASSNVQSSAKKTKRKSPTPEVDASSPSDEEESEASGTDEDEEDESDESDDNSEPSSRSKQKRPSPVPQSTASRKKVKTTPAATVKIPAHPFKAPKGYESMTLSVSDYASDMSLFDNLSDKQIWHISVPDSVSINSIKELDIEAVLKGRPILSKNGVEYNMQPLPSRKEVIFLPHGPEVKYRPSARAIDRSFHMREVSIRPELGDDTSLIFTATEIGKPKEIRKQPEGLRTRYVPYGAPTVQAGPEDVEMDDAFEVPADVAATLSSPARSRVNGDKGHEKNPEKKKKKKQQNSGDDASTEKKKKRKRMLVDEEAL